MNKCTNCGATVSSDTISYDPDGFALCEWCEEQMILDMAEEEELRFAQSEKLYEIDIADLQKIALGEMTADEYMKKHPLK